MTDDTNPNLEPLSPEPVPSEPPGPATSAPDAEAAPAVDAAESPPGSPSWKTWVAVAATAAVVGAAAVFGISAATSTDSPNAAASTQTDGTGAAADAPSQSGAAPVGPGGQAGGVPGRPGGFGEISKIDGSTLTIKDPSGETTKVVTSSDTEVTTSESGSVDDVKVGDTVMVVGAGSSTKIAATRVTDEGKVDADAAPPGMTGNGPSAGARQLPDGQAPPGAGGPMAPPGAGSGSGNGDMIGTRGVVKTVGAGTFTVTGINGDDVTITTSSSTDVTIARDAKVSDLKLGDSVTVQGAAEDGVITATRIREGAMGGFRGGPPGARQGASSDDGTQ